MGSTHGRNEGSYPKGGADARNPHRRRSGTFVVISATAIAAVVQLRHLRANNQLEGLLDIVGRIEDQNPWIDETRRQLPAMLAGPPNVRSVIDRTFDRNVAWLQLGNRNERILALLKRESIMVRYRAIQ